MDSGVEGGGQLFLVMTDREFRFLLYRVRDDYGSDGDEVTIKNLGEPLLKMEKSIFPRSMSFTLIGKRIFMVGGHLDNATTSVNTFIYDTVSNNLYLGPTLKSGKNYPILLTFGSKLFALSNILYSCDLKRKNVCVGLQPLIEMLDTEDLKSGWSPLPVPALKSPYGVGEDYVFHVYSVAAVYIGDGSHSVGVIFISGRDGNVGTYAFEVDKQKWNYVCDEVLPFHGHAMTIPNAPSLCCAASIKSKRFSAFRFHYSGDENNRVFQVDEIEIDCSHLLFPPLPLLVSARPLQTVFGPDGRVYFVATGVDKAQSYHNRDSYRYVKISALEISSPESGFNEGHWLKSCGKKKSQIGHDESMKIDLNKGQPSLKRCRTEKMKKRKQMGPEKEEVAEETKLLLSGIWKGSFFGGPVCNPLIHVAGAFAT